MMPVNDVKLLLDEPELLELLAPPPDKVRISWAFVVMANRSPYESKEESMIAVLMPMLKVSNNEHAILNTT